MPATSVGDRSVKSPTSTSAAGAIKPDSLWARYSSGITAECFWSGGYRDRIEAIWAGYLSASILSIDVPEHNSNAANDAHHVGDEIILRHHRQCLQVHERRRAPAHPARFGAAIAHHEH